MSEKDIKKNEVPQNRDKEFLADPWARTRTRNGLAADEVISALQNPLEKVKKEQLVNLRMRCIFLHHKWKKNYGAVYKLFQLKTLVWVILKHQFLLIA